MFTKLLMCSVIASIIAGVADWMTNCKNIELTTVLGVATFFALFMLSLII